MKNLLLILVTISILSCTKKLKKMKLDNIINWTNPKKSLPKISNGYGHGLSENVLTLLADNGKTGGINRYVFNFYDHVLQEWNVKEVIAWTYLKTYKHLQDYHIDEDC